VKGARVASNGNVLNHITISDYPNSQSLPDVAFNGQDYLAVWTDNRDDVSHIYYTRINQGGIVLNPIGIKLSGTDSSNYYSNGVVASNGNNYLVSYIGNRLSGITALFSIINSSGIIVDTMPVELCDDTFLLMEITSVSNGQEYLIAWTNLLRDTIGVDLYFRRVSADGQLLDASPQHVAYNYWGINDINIAFGGGCYLAVWDDNDNIWGVRIQPDGTVLDPNGFLICSDSGQQVDPAVTSDGHRSLVTWTDGRTGNYDIYATFVDSAGNVGLAENLTNPVTNRLSFDVSPSPFNKEIKIKFNYPLQNISSLNIYDITGKLVKSFANPLHDNVVWNGKDNQGHVVPDGTYFCRLSISSGAVTKKILKLKN